jgi:hypothetical protein
MILKKTKEQRRNRIILCYLETKFHGCELLIQTSTFNPNFIMYFLGNTMIMNVWKYSEKTNFRANFNKRFLEEFATWFPKFKYKRRILRDWLFENYEIKLPDGCELYVP